MEPGPNLQPSAALLAWLESNARTTAGKQRLLRLPVIVRFEDEYRLGLGQAHVGSSPRDLGADPIALDLDDGAMGVGLLDQLRERCPAGLDGCAVWLEGYWGRLLPGLDDDDPTGGPQPWPFAVLRLRGMIAPDEAASARAQVER